MTRYIFLGIFIFLAIASCKEKEELPPFTEICVKAQHHEARIPNCDIYIKYNTDFFPGYHDLSIYDTLFTTGADGAACFQYIPYGRHWLVGDGYDHDTQEPVQGSVRIEISQQRYLLDTIIYVSE